MPRTLSGQKKKTFTVGKGLELGKGGLEEEVYLRTYYKSECLPIKQLIPIWKDCRKFHGYYIFEDWLEERDKLRKNLYHLGLTVGHDFVPHVHQEMANMFVQKQFDGVYHDGYTLSEVRKAIGKQPREQEMLLLAPRGAFKSTVDCVDCVSWLINVPDVRILIIGPKHSLALKFLLQVKGYFHKPEHADPTKFQAMFPEYILPTKEAESESDLYCPARRVLGNEEPNLTVSSTGSSLSGWHTDILKGDDTVDDENSNTEGTREKLKMKWDNALNLVDEWGFIDQIGTRYFVDDLWGDI